MNNFTQKSCVKFLIFYWYVMLFKQSKISLSVH